MIMIIAQEMRKVLEKVSVEVITNQPPGFSMHFFPGGDHKMRLVISISALNTSGWKQLLPYCFPIEKNDFIALSNVTDACL